MDTQQTRFHDPGQYPAAILAWNLQAEGWLQQGGVSEMFGSALY